MCGGWVLKLCTNTGISDLSTYSLTYLLRHPLEQVLVELEGLTVGAVGQREHARHVVGHVGDRDAEELLCAHSLKVGYGLGMGWVWVGYGLGMGWASGVVVGRVRMGTLGWYETGS